MEPSSPPRITFRQMWLQILEAFNLERGLPYTIYGLTVRPGRTIREYLLEDRSRLVPPFRLLVFSAGIATLLVSYFFDFSEFVTASATEGYRMGQGAVGDAEVSGETPSEDLMKFTEILGQLFQNYFNVFLLLLVPLAALVTYLVLRKGYFYPEHLVINAYMTSWQNMLTIAFTPLYLVFDYTTVSYFLFFPSIAYFVFVFYQFFRLKFWEGVWKTLLFLLFYFGISAIIGGVLGALLAVYLMK